MDRKAAIVDPSKTVFSGIIVHSPARCRRHINLCTTARTVGKNNSQRKCTKRVWPLLPFSSTENMGKSLIPNSFPLIHQVLYRRVENCPTSNIYLPLPD